MLGHDFLEGLGREGGTCQESLRCRFVEGLGGWGGEGVLGWGDIGVGGGGHGVGKEL